MTTAITVAALTGGIGSGKSQVARLFQGWGAQVVDADELARATVAPGSTGLAKTVASFGEGVLNADGSLNRTKLAEVIFSSEAKRRELEAILHPLIREMWLARLAELLRTVPPPPLIVYTLPLFFESGVEYPEITRSVHVSAPEELRIQRVVARDSCSEESVRKRIRAQLSDEEKNSRSDFIIVNDSNLEELSARARVVFNALSTP